jgi:hypothetical protein
VDGKDKQQVNKVSGGDGHGCFPSAQFEVVIGDDFSARAGIPIRRPIDITLFAVRRGCGRRTRLLSRALLSRASAMRS